MCERVCVHALAHTVAGKVPQRAVAAFVRRAGVNYLVISVATLPSTHFLALLLS